MKGFLALFLAYLVSLSLYSNNHKYDSLFNSAPHENAERIIKYFNQKVIKTDSLTAANEIEALKKQSIKKGDQITTSIIEGLRGVFYFHYVPDKRDSSIILLKKAIEQIETKKKYQLTSARLTNVLGIFLFRALDYQGALENILKSEYQFSNVGFDKVENIDFYLYNIGVVHFGYKQYEKAKNYILRSLHYLDSTDTNALEAEYNMLGVLYTQLEKRDSAIHYLSLAKNLMLSTKDSSHLSATDCNLGLLYFNSNKYSEAINIYHKAYSNANKYQESLNLASASTGLARSYFEINKIDSSLFWVNIADSLIKKHKIRNPDYLYKLYQLKGKLYDKQGKSRLASQFKDSTIKKIEELQAAKDLSEVIDLNVKLIESKHATEVKLLEERGENERKSTMIVLFSSAIIIICIASLWHMSITKRKAEKLRFIAEQKQDKEKIDSFKKRLRDKNALIEATLAQIDILERMKTPSHEQQEYLKDLKESIILTDEDWIDFKKSFDQVHPQFISRLTTEHPKLTQAEIRFLVLLKLGLSVKEMANTLAILPESVRKTRLRLTKKLNLESYSDLNQRINSI